MQFFALPLIAEIGAALAGFATLAGVIRHDDLDADAIFAAVFNSLIAVVFALIAILLAGASGSGAQSIRFAGAALLLASLVAISREVSVYRASWRDASKTPDVQGLGSIFGIAALVTMVPPPLLAFAVVSGAFPDHAALFYELAVFSHLLIAIFFLLYVVWRHLALRSRQRNSRTDR